MWFREPTGVSSWWRNLLVVLVGIGLLFIVSTWLYNTWSYEREQFLAEAAWEVRRGDKLKAVDDAKSKARKAFLDGRFNDCLLALEKGGVFDDRLESKSRLAFLFSVEWPKRVAFWLARDLDKDGHKELLRLVDPGFGIWSRRYQMEVFRWDRARGYVRAKIRYFTPTGKSLTDFKLVDPVKLEPGSLGCVLYGKRYLLVMYYSKKELRAFRFRIDKRTASAAEAKGMRVKIGKSSWIWDEKEKRWLKISAADT